MHIATPSATSNLSTISYAWLLRPLATALLVTFVSSNCTVNCTVHAQDIQADQNLKADVHADNGPVERVQVKDAKGERKNKHWGERNLGLFIILVNAIWIIPMVIIFTFYHRHQKRKAEDRRTALREVATELSLEFHEVVPDGTLSDRFGALPEFGLGRKKKFSNLLIAETADVRISIFDYQYTTGHGKSTQVHKETIAAVESPSLMVPSFQLRPEGFWDRVGSVIGIQDIDFDNHAGFSNAFVLKSNNEKSTRDFLDRPLLDYFAARSDLWFETSSGVFAYFRRDNQVHHGVDAVRAFLGEGFQTLQMLQERLERSGE